MASMSPPHTVAAASAASSNGGSVSPQQTATPKNVAFELLFLETPQYRARLPMRVQIYPHDTTDSIVTTVKNFYGLYSGPTGSKGVSFEDEHGNTLIARYENFRNNMVVYVRVIEEPPVPATSYPAHSYHHASTYYGGEGYPAHQAQHFAQNVSRPSSRTSRRRSPSPNLSRGRRSASTSTNGKKGRSRSSKTRGSTARSHTELYSDSINGYSSGDEHGSSSGKSKEQLGNTDISLENIVEGGRRKRAKFESSVSGDRFFYLGRNVMLTTTGNRNCRYSHRRRCPQPLRTLPSLPPAGLNHTVLPCLLSSQARIPLQTRDPCNRRRLTAMASCTPTCIRHRARIVVVTATASAM